MEKYNIPFKSLMLRKTRKMVMLSKAHNKYLSHPSMHPSKNEGFAQDDHYFCAASKHRSDQIGSLRNISKSLKKEDIIVSVRKGLIRVSQHFYNSPGEVDALRSAFIRHRKTKAA